MPKRDDADRRRMGLSRRDFVRTGGAAIAGGAALGGAALPAGAEESRVWGREALFGVPQGQDAKIKGYRTLGRTGFEVSDIGMGSVPLRESAVVRYAYDKGINYFDTADGYQNGNAERAIGEALQHMDRSKVFVTSKTRLNPSDDTEAVLAKVRGSLERLRTDYLDAYYIWGVGSVDDLNHAGYHAAMEQLKAEGRVRFRGVSCHGPGRGFDGTAEDILTAAAEDGRFDLMLLTYNFLAHDEGDRVLAACKANNVGTTAMKTAAGSLSYEPVDPENLTDAQQRSVDRLVQRGRSREAALEQLQATAQRQKELYDRTRPFADRYGIDTQEQLRVGSIHWVIQNPDMHSACVAFTDFGLIDRVVPISGTAMTEPEQAMLHEIKVALSSEYCRHGCTECAGACPAGVPVSTIMRYGYYYEGQKLEKHAMALYAGLEGPGADACLDCQGHCAGACRHGVDIQSNLTQVHGLLTLA